MDSSHSALPTFWKLLAKRYAFFGLLAIWTVGFGILLLLFPSPKLFLVLNHIRTHWADHFFTVTDLLGEGYGQLILAIVFFILGKRYWSLLLALTYSFSGLVSQLLKKVVFTDAPRPLAYFRAQGIVPETMPWVTLREYNSFPSGHTITCFSLGCCLAFFYRKPLLGLLFFAIAAVGSYSRIYAGQHFPLDIYAGALVGVACNVFLLWVLLKFFPNLYQKFALE